ncbi:MAG: hypothetical protein LBT59_22940 [Clostridiales bacterium]|jgi:hypothetical protein|nr:hypothetical protein [Clostridiales bacterium]
MKKSAVAFLAILVTLGMLISIPTFAAERPKNLNGKYRRLHLMLSAKANVEVYEGEKVVFRYKARSASTYWNSDAQYDGYEVDVDIPAYKDCEVKITATEDGHMTYIAAEAAYSRPAYRAVIYNQIDFVEGDEYVGSFPAYEEADYDKDVEGTEIRYTLVDPWGYELEPTIEGDYEDMFVTFEYDTNDSSLGVVVPVKEKSLLGRTVTAKAVAGRKGVFEGWYEDDELIEESETYKFEAEYDRTLEARFAAKDPDAVETTKSSSLKSKSYWGWLW